MQLMNTNCQHNDPDSFSVRMWLEYCLAMDTTGIDSFLQCWLSLVDRRQWQVSTNNNGKVSLITDSSIGVCVCVYSQSPVQAGVHLTSKANLALVIHAEMCCNI